MLGLAFVGGLANEWVDGDWLNWFDLDDGVELAGLIIHASDNIVKAKFGSSGVHKEDKEDTKSEEGSLE